MMELLAYLIITEAEGEPDEGKIAVGCVPMTRAREWTMLLSDVIFMPGAFAGLRNPGRFKTAYMMRLEDPKRWDEFKEIADSVLSDKVENPVLGATHFFSVEYPPPDLVLDPRMIFLRQIGKHRFYREER